MVTYNKSTLVLHNLLDEKFFSQIIEDSLILSEYNDKFYKINKELEFLCEDLFYIFYKHIVTIEKDSSIHSFLLEKITDSIAYKKISLRTRGSSFETYLILKYFIDQIFIRLKGTSHIKDIKNYYENLSLYKDDLSSIKEEIHTLIDKSKKEASKSKVENDINELKILEKLLKRHINEQNNNEEVKSKDNYTRLDSNLKDQIKDEINSLLLNDIYKENTLKYDDYLKDVLDNLEDNSLNQAGDEKYANFDEMDKNTNDESKDFDDKDLSSLSDESLSDDEKEDKKEKLSDFKHELIDKLDNLMEDESLDAEDFLESLIMQIEELSLLMNQDEHEDGQMQSEEDSKNSATDSDNYSDFDSSNTSLRKVPDSNFDNPFLDKIDEDVDQKHIIDGQVEGRKPLYEEIIDTIDFVNDKSNYKANSDNTHSMDQIYKDVILRLESLQGKILINEEKINKVSKDIKMDSDLKTALSKLEKTLSSVGTLSISKHSLSALSMDDAIALEKRLRSSDFKRFIDKVGRKKTIAAKAKKKKTLSKDHIVDKITTSDDMDNIIEDEILQFALNIEEFEWDFYDRLLNKAVLSNQFVSNHGKNKGPIILCYDGSGSMEGLKIEETKAHIIAILDIAKSQKRKVILIQFASKKEDLYTKEVNPAYISTNDIYEIYDTFIKGGTDFEKPLKKAMHMLKQENYREGDILFITDGHCEISHKFISEFNYAKHTRRFKLYSIIIHGHTYSDYGDLGKVSDEVLEIKKSNMNDWNEKISEQIFSII